MGKNDRKNIAHGFLKALGVYALASAFLSEKEAKKKDSRNFNRDMRNISNDFAVATDEFARRQRRSK